MQRECQVQKRPENTTKNQNTNTHIERTEWQQQIYFHIRIYELAMLLSFVPFHFDKIR